MAGTAASSPHHGAARSDARRMRAVPGTGMCLSMLPGTAGFQPALWKEKAAILVRISSPPAELVSRLAALMPEGPAHSAGGDEEAEGEADPDAPSPSGAARRRATRRPAPGPARRRRRQSTSGHRDPAPFAKRYRFPPITVGGPRTARRGCHGNLMRRCVIGRRGRASHVHD